MECKLIEGQHVVCLQSVWKFPNGVDADTFGVISPKENVVYTVRKVMSFEEHGIFIYLKEIVNPTFKFRTGIYEPMFNHLYFKPLQKLTPEMFTKEIENV